MRRIMYISTVAGALPDEALGSIGRVASHNNKRLGITGVLMCAHEFFFQILEGEGERVDPLVERIRRDPRHRDLLILKVEDDVSERLFPNWSMRTIRLDEAQGMILQAVRIMLENITQSHRIIERYTQPTVLRFLTQGVNPLEIPPRKIERVVLFGDMVGFSYLSHKFPPEEVTEVVGAYLAICSTRVRECGGEVSKYIGDCVMAHFPASHTDAAIQASMSVLGDLQSLRQASGGPRLSRYVFGGFGLTRGGVIEGNVGSTIKMDYTILGEPVNQAQRLESLTRTIRRAIAVSPSIREGAVREWPFEWRGQFRLKGQAAPCSVYSLNDPVVCDFKDYAGLESAVEAEPKL